MDLQETQLRAVFATCALLSLMAIVEQLRVASAGSSTMLVASIAALGLSALEALGLWRVASAVPWRLLAAVLLGVASLHALERCF